MRKFGMSLIACGLFAAPYAALSQPGSTSTPDEYVCALTGECGEEAAAPEAQDGSGPRLEATRGFTLARPDAAPAQPRQQRQTTRRTPRFQMARPMRPRVATQQRGRVNLRLAFAPGSSSLSAAAQAEVRAFAEAMRRPQLVTMRFRIEGHTDSVGGRTINGPLSQRRAQAVADYLVAQGVAQTRLEVQGFGYDRPLPGMAASSGRNRRVEAVRIS
ncbi:OmpA family protein [Sphingosinicella sp.]|uniref:OmpA family protein n=1 Tax=Sphingosinicella sp. TaxID=1917971 RepID=UPI004037A115